MKAAQVAGIHGRPGMGVAGMGGGGSHKAGGGGGGGSHKPKSHKGAAGASGRQISKV